MPPKTDSTQRPRTQFIVGTTSRTESVLQSQTESLPPYDFPPESEWLDPQSKPPSRRPSKVEAWMKSLPPDPSKFVANPDMQRLQAGEEPQQSMSKGKKPAALQSTTTPKSGDEPKPGDIQSINSAAKPSTTTEDWSHLGRWQPLAWPSSEETSSKGSFVEVGSNEKSVEHPPTSEDDSRPKQTTPLRKKPLKKTDKDDKGKPQGKGPKGGAPKFTPPGSNST